MYPVDAPTVSIMVNLGRPKRWEVWARVAVIVLAPVAGGLGGLLTGMILIDVFPGLLMIGVQR